MAAHARPDQNGEPQPGDGPADAGARADPASGPHPPAAATATAAATAPAAATTSALDARVPTTAKDISLKDFLNKMDDYAPIIPDAVTGYYMTKAGLPPPPQTDPRLSRLLALATQKFVADIAADAYQYSRVRASNSSAGNNAMGNLGAAAAAAGAPGPPGAGAGGGGGSAQPGGAGAGGSKDQGRAAASSALGIQRPGFGGGGTGGSQNRTVLTMEDLGMAVGEYGVNVKRGEFYR